MGAFLRIDHVQLAMPTGGEADARGFYVGKLGFAEVPKPPELASRGGVWFRSDSIALHIGVDPAFTPARKAHPAFRCAGYAELVARLRDVGVTIVEDGLPFDGKPHCYLTDPFGNRLEVIAE